MTAEQILQLVQAGYTKQEIVQLTGVQEPAPEPVPAAEPVPEPKSEPAPAEDQKPESGPTIADVLNGITKLTAAIQANAIANSVMPQQHQASAEDMIAQIIRPTFKERNGN